MKSVRRGLTLLEVVIVAAIISIIAAFAVPSILSSRKSANEQSAVSYMRAWLAAQEMYKRKNGTYADADEQLVGAKLLTVTKGDGDGYIFSIDSPPSHLQWYGSARPQVPGTSGDRYFYIAMDGVVHYAHGRRATKADAAVGK